MATMTFQRCTDKSMGDILRRQQLEEQQKQRPSSTKSVKSMEEDVVFGAPDEVGATQRQVCGAAVAGGMAGALVGGAVGALAGAAGAAFAAAKRECEIGEVARTTGDVVCDKSEILLKNQTVNRTVERASRTAKQASFRASQTKQQLSFRASQTKEKCVLKASQTKEKCVLKAVQIKEGASKMKENIGQRLGKGRRRQGNTNGADPSETEFHECLDDNILDEEDGEFEDAREEEKELPRSVKEVIGLL